MVSVWALEPYYGGSHKQFLDGLVRHSSHVFSMLTLPGRHWKWRMHGGALALAARARNLAENAHSPDIFFASDMLDLPAFLGTLRSATGLRAGPATRPIAGPVPCGPRAAQEWASRGPPIRVTDVTDVPSIVYFHENQLTYPLPLGEERDLGYGFKNVTSALAADAVLFNSRYHRTEFLAAVGGMLGAMPDAVPEWAAEEIEARSSVLPLGCDLRALDRHRSRAAEQVVAGRWGDPAAGPLVVWNQRWEYDKAPEELFRALQALKERGAPFRVAVAGSGATVSSPEFLRARAALGERVVQWGRLDSRSDYAALLWAGDVVVSTAIHEFFGVAVLEAVYCGCRPVLPRRLSYPELIPAEAHGEVLYGEGEVVDALSRALADPHPWSEDWQRTWVAPLDWGSLKTRYDETIWDCATRYGARGRLRWTGFR